jgi:hypothetical protein
MFSHHVLFHMLHCTIKISVLFAGRFSKCRRRSGIDSPPIWVATTHQVGKLLDGGRFHLQVTYNEKNDEYHKSWLFRYLRSGKDPWMGLGS